MQLGQSHEAQVDRIEHQLDTHEEHDRVSAEEHAGHPKTEEDGGESESRPEQHQTFRLARTTAPTIAASSRIEVISNGIRYTWNRGAATAPTTPCATDTCWVISPATNTVAGSVYVGHCACSDAS